VAGGWLAGTNAARLGQGQEPLQLPPTTMIRRPDPLHPPSSSGKVSADAGPNFGLDAGVATTQIRDKRSRIRGPSRDRSLKDLEPFANSNRVGTGPIGIRGKCHWASTATALQAASAAQLTSLKAEAGAENRMNRVKSLF